MYSNYLRIARLAVPIILANAAVPLLGLADTAAIGQTGSAEDLGAIALAALVFSFVYWGFGFLRMGTTGFMAQAHGANNQVETHAVLFRSLLLAGMIGVFLILFQKIIGESAFYLLNTSPVLENLVRDYFYIRIWGAPATLITFSLLGTLIGLGWTRRLLWVQLFLNGLNIGLNIFFVVVMEWGVKGIAAGTVMAEWATLVLALYLVFKNLGIINPLRSMRELWPQVSNGAKLVAMLRVNSDIMIRTFALLGGFAWFTNQGASYGAHTLAANHVLLQFVSFSAFVLDGFAHVAEMLAGQAFGAKKREIFIRDIKHSTYLAAGSAVFLALICLTSSDLLVPLLTRDQVVQEVAAIHIPLAATYILISFAAFQLDGIFIGLTKTKEMRNSTIIALIGFIGISFILQKSVHNQGLWIAFIIYVFLRALTLGAYYRKVIRHF